MDSMKLDGRLDVPDSELYRLYLHLGCLQKVADMFGVTRQAVSLRLKSFPKIDHSIKKEGTSSLTYSLYLKLGSYRKVAEIMGISRKTVRLKIGHLPKILK